MINAGWKLIPGWVLLTIVAFSASGQTAVNPFDLVPRLDIETGSENGIVLEETSNPFDIIPPPAGVAVVEPSPAKPVVAENPRINKSERAVKNQTKPDLYGRFVFAVIMIMLVVLTLLFTMFRTFFQRAYRAFTNDNMLAQIHRDQGAIVDLPYFFYYCFFFFNAGIFLFLVLHHWGLDLGMSYWKSLLVLIGGISLVFFSKHLLLKIVGGIFPISKELNTYSFTIVIFSIMLGMILVPLNLFIAFGPDSATGAFILITLGLAGLIYLFRAVRSLLLGSRYLAFHKFHFLLYICTVEIAPLIVLVKLLKDYSGSL